MLHCTIWRLLEAMKSPILDDADAKEKERANDRQDVSMGVMNDWEYRAKWYGEDETTAKMMLPKMEDMTTEGQEETE